MLQDKMVCSLFYLIVHLTVAVLLSPLILTMYTLANKHMLSRLLHHNYLLAGLSLTNNIWKTLQWQITIFSITVFSCS